MVDASPFDTPDAVASVIAAFIACTLTRVLPRPCRVGIVGARLVDVGRVRAHQ